MSIERQLWFVKERHVEVRRIAAPPPSEDEAVALASGVSQGTELLLYRGEGPTPFDPSLDAPDAPTYPRRYGYAWVGRSIASGALVFALAPHGDRHRSSGMRVLREDIPPSRAVLAANLETAINVVWDAGIALGDEVLVFGGGVVGQLISWLAVRAGAIVRLVEPSARRRDAARAMGIHDTVPPGGVEGPADVVVEATGRPAVLSDAIHCAGEEAVIAVASFYGARVHPLPLGAEFHRRRLRLVSSQVSRIPPARSIRWSTERRFALVQHLLASAELDALLEPPVPIERAPEVYARLDASPGDALQVVFAYE